MANESESVPTGVQVTMRHSPTGGAPGEHSPYYRRLLSAGYKGYLQGVIGGGTLYGLMGAGIGLLVAGGLALSGTLAFSTGALALAPLLGGMGLLKGSSTFGNIGSVAAITAESSEMIEERRNLLEWYYDLPMSHEYDPMAREIERQLTEQHKVKPPKHVLHLRTLLVSAVLGAAIAIGLAYFAPIVFAEIHFLQGALAVLAENGLITSAAGHGVTALGATVAAAIGGLTGGMIGLDRYYVRRWLDMSENLVSDPWQIKESIQDKEKDTQRLVESSPTRGSITAGRHKHGRNGRQLPADNPSPEPNPPLVHTERPMTSVSSAQLESRLSEIHAAMSRPTV